MEIPNWPATRPLIQTDRKLLQQLFQQLQPQVSELCFAGLYLFRHAHGYRISRINKTVLVSGHGYDGNHYCLPPLGSAIDHAIDLILDSGLTIYGADDRFIQQHMDGRPVSISADRNNSDYLYNKAELATLPGNRYHKKRNRIAYLTSRHDCLIQPYSAEHRGGCLTLLGQLAQQQLFNRTATASRAAELAACSEALELAEELGLQGVVVLIDDVVRGFTLGESLNNQTAVCHFEKSDPYLEGMAQLLNREFAARLFCDSSYINREQDLGDTGLRQAKNSYHPCSMVIKYMVKPI